MANRDTVKQWFETGDYPTQNQFWQFFDWVRFVEDAIAMEGIAGLVDALATKANSSALAPLADIINREALNPSGNITYSLIASRRLQTVIMIPSITMTVKIGTTVGGEEVMIATEITAGVPFIHDCAVYAIINTPIYISGITAAVQIFIYKR